MSLPELILLWLKIPEEVIRLAGKYCSYQGQFDVSSISPGLSKKGYELLDKSETC